MADPHALHRQSRARSRSASSARARGLGIRTVQAVQRRRPRTCWPSRLADEAVEIGPPHGGEILPEHRGGRRRGRARAAPTPFIRATASSSENAGLRRRWSRRRASSSSARRPRRSAPWATRPRRARSRRRRGRADRAGLATGGIDDVEARARSGRGDRLSRDDQGGGRRRRARHPRRRDAGRASKR